MGGDKEERASGGKQGKEKIGRKGGRGRGERFNGTRMGGISRKEGIGWEERREGEEGQWWKARKGRKDE